MDILKSDCLNDFLVRLSLTNLIGRNLAAEQLFLDLMNAEWNNKTSSWQPHFYSIAKFLDNFTYPSTSKLKSQWKHFSTKILNSFDKNNLKLRRGRVF